jgi:hypothetical protein
MSVHHRYTLCPIARYNLLDHANNDRRDDVVKWPLLTLIIFGVVYSFFGGFQADIAYSGEMSDEMKKMQEQLNNQV